MLPAWLVVGADIEGLQVKSDFEGGGEEWVPLHVEALESGDFFHATVVNPELYPDIAKGGAPYLRLCYMDGFFREMVV